MSLTNTIELTQDSRPQAVDFDILSSFDEAQEEGEPDFVVELIDLYLGEAPRIFSAIREGLATSDWLSAKRAAHSLRGSSSNLGVLQMALISGELERLATSHDIAAEQLLVSLEAEFARVEKILGEERQRRMSCVY